MVYNAHIILKSNSFFLNLISTDFIIFKTIVWKIFLVAFHLSVMFTRMTFYQHGGAICRAPCACKIQHTSPKQKAAPVRARAEQASAQITPYSRGCFLHRPATFLIRRSERCSIHPLALAPAILHTYYSLLIRRWDRQSGAAESAPLYTNHFIARRPYNIPWLASSLRPRRPTMSCAAPPPPGKGCTATHYAASGRVSSSDIDRAEHHNTCTAHICSLVVEEKVGKTHNMYARFTH